MDRGCPAGGPSCLTCPLVVCVEDVEKAVRQRSPHPHWLMTLDKGNV